MERATTPMSAVRIDEAAAEHLEQIAEIYAHWVRTSPATFDLEPPTIEQWRRLLAGADPARGHFFLVALDASGIVLGYAKSARFRDRAAYDTTCEVGVYVAPAATGRGVGSALYARLLELLDGSPLRLATAGVTEPNEASTALHLAFGFERVGTFTGVGVKFEQPWDVTWYQRPLDGSVPIPSRADGT
jgi:phosphinothricin acetyltransferase